MRTFFFMMLIIVSVLISGCDDFLGVRDPEPPAPANPLHWTPAASPQTLVTNMRNAFKYREYESYMRCLADTSQSNQHFRFVPAAQSVVLFPGRFDGWDLGNEQDYFQNLISAVPADSALSLLLHEEEPFSELGDTIQYQLVYEISAAHSRSGISRQFSGRLTWRLVKDASNYWVISRWDDDGLHQFSSWSDLKALF